MIYIWTSDVTNATNAAIAVAVIRASGIATVVVSEVTGNTCGPSTNVRLDDFIARLPPPKRRRPQQPAAIDPWMPRAIAAAPPIAWPATLRRFRGNV